jgi:hypothetical protein
MRQALYSLATIVAIFSIGLLFSSQGQAADLNALWSIGLPSFVPSMSGPRIVLSVIRRIRSIRRNSLLGRVLIL